MYICCTNMMNIFEMCAKITQKYQKKVKKHQFCIKISAFWLIFDISAKGENNQKCYLSNASTSRSTGG